MLNGDDDIAVGRQSEWSTLILDLTFFDSYEPELFPGLIYRMTKPKIVLLIFVSGKIVLTGKLFIFISVNWPASSVFFSHMHDLFPC